ncbi:hypothetical protein K501DRAFT_280285 [Backusella circina FSU 941]|nr:hypothetical protein K501DRAFT_280285 [Backusella circina FSU 941]
MALLFVTFAKNKVYYILIYIPNLLFIHCHLYTLWMFTQLSHNILINVSVYNKMGQHERRAQKEFSEEEKVIKPAVFRKAKTRKRKQYTDATNDDILSAIQETISANIEATIPQNIKANKNMVTLKTKLMASKTLPKGIKLATDEQHGFRVGTTENFLRNKYKVKTGAKIWTDLVGQFCEQLNKLLDLLQIVKDQVGISIIDDIVILRMTITVKYDRRILLNHNLIQFMIK